MKNMYGVLVGKTNGYSHGAHCDISATERGAKIYATRHGYAEVTCRPNGGYNAFIIARKVGNKWQKV